MSTFIHPSATNTQLTQYNSAENIRSIFFTNLILLGVQEYSSQPQGSVSTPVRPSQSLSKSRLGASQISTSLQSESARLPQQQQQHVIIDSFNFGATGVSKPLELHKHVLAKGHQSSKALEFILWFLFTRLDKSLAKERFKDCWPILDRHDAREFRNVAHKWLEELRKEGCFGIGHNMELGSRTTVATKGSTSSGLGLFLPTILRSYLDDSIGERVEQLVLVLSTYVLSCAVTKEMQQSAPLNSGSNIDRERDLENEDRILCDLASQAPESAQEQGVLLGMIDSHIVRRSRFFLEDLERQRKVQHTWNAMSAEMTATLNTLSEEQSKGELERRAFMTQHHELEAQTGHLSLEELQILEDRCIEKVNSQWQPILSFVEQHVGRKEALQSLLDSDHRKGDSVLDGQRLQMNLLITPEHSMEHGAVGQDSNVDLTSVLKLWRRSLLMLESRSSDADSKNDFAADYTVSMEDLSKYHYRQLEKVRKSKLLLETKLKETRRRVERLQKEQNIVQRPYRRLLSTIPASDGRAGDTLGSSLSSATRDAYLEAMNCTRDISAALATLPEDDRSSPDRQLDIRESARMASSLEQAATQDSQLTLREALCTQDASDILLVKSTPVVAIASLKPRPSLHTTTAHSKIAALAPKPAAPAPKLSVPTPNPQPLATLIKPPPSILSRPEQQLRNAARMVTPGASSIKPAPEDLVVRVQHKDANVRNSYEFICDEPAMTQTSPLDSVPTTTLEHRSLVTKEIRNPVSSSTAGQQIAHRPNALEKRRADFLGSMLRSRKGLSVESGTRTQLIGEVTVIADPMTHASGSKDNTAKPDTHDNHTVPPESIAQTTSRTLAKSLLQERPGVSQKRRQPSETRSEVSGALTPTQQDHLSPHEDPISRQKEDANVFDNDADETPSTPSKRRRVDSLGQHFVGRRTSSVYDANIPVTDDKTFGTNLLFASAFNTPDRPGRRPIKVVNSPKLTLDDLRAPTPKPLKTMDQSMDDGELAMPIMFLHTPQQQKLFQIRNIEAPKLARPFTALTPPPKASSPSNRPPSLLKTSRTKSSFASSIFDRFEKGLDLDNTECSGVTDKSLTHSSEPSPFIASMATTPAVSSSNGKSTMPLTDSVLVSNFLNGDAVVLDMTVNKDSSPASKTVGTASSQSHAKTNANGSTALPFRTPHSSSENYSKVVKNNQQSVNHELMKAASATDLNASRSRWGRPPSWKPPSPKMIDMERKREADRAHKLAVKNPASQSLLFDPLSRSSFGPHRASVYGRSNISASSLTSASFSSSCSLSSKSCRSDTGLPLSRFESGQSIPQKESRTADDDLEKDEYDDDDTRGYSPPSVSPIRVSLSDTYRSFSASMISTARRSMFPLPGKAQSNAFTRSIRGASAAQAIGAKVAAEPTESQYGDSKDKNSVLVDRYQPQSSDNAKYLDQPIPNDEFHTSGQEVDETILNYELQPIFDGINAPRAKDVPRGINNVIQESNGVRLDVHETGVERRADSSPSSVHGQQNSDGDLTGGLFDEAMPDALDPDEALWESTELFS
ncbi:HAUS augmin-like complex subunit 6 [Haplosporangium sp. Z 11]|nr:HAUS augmin-like complex subunit 6 [Haplosporangium sp. Z 11]